MVAVDERTPLRGDGAGGCRARVSARLKGGGPDPVALIVITLVVVFALVFIGCAGERGRRCLDASLCPVSSSESLQMAADASRERQHYLRLHGLRAAISAATPPSLFTSTSHKTHRAGGPG